MMYRNYIAEDKDEVIALCNKHGIDVPENSMLFVAEDENDKVVGICGIRAEFFIEPLISENPISAVKLFNKTIKHLQNSQIKRVRCICKEKFARTYEKVGFEQIEKHKIIMEKEL